MGSACMHASHLPAYAHTDASIPRTRCQPRPLTVTGMITHLHSELAHRNRCTNASRFRTAARVREMHNNNANAMVPV